ncbi:hypothetical protein ACWY4P_25125 [Streptomyces sp. LZ34]
MAATTPGSERRRPAHGSAAKKTRAPAPSTTAQDTGWREATW